MSKTNPSLLQRIKSIQLLILDVDGVLTDGQIYLSSQGEEILSFHIHDGAGIKQLQQLGIHIAVISGRDTKPTQCRLKKLGIQHAFLGQENKIEAYQTLKQTLSVANEAIAYIGDDLPDITVMQQVGLPIAVANAVNAIKNIAFYCTKNTGGNGAVREVCDLFMMAHQPNET